MRLGRLLIVLAIAVILIVAVIFAVLNLNSSGEGEEGPTSSTDIVIVVQPIPRGNIITAEALDYLAFPTEDTIANMFTNVSDVVGGRARYDLEPGLPLTDNMVVGDAADLSETGSDSALLIPEGMVAFPVTINRFSSLAYGLRAGDHVNVIASMLLVDVDPDFQTLTPNNTGAVIAPGSSVLVTTEGDEEATSELVLDPLLSVVTAQIASGGSTAPQGQAVVDPVLNQPFYVVPSEDAGQRPRLVSQTLLQDIVVLHVGNFLYTDENGDEVENAYEPQSPGVDSSGQALPAGPKDPPDIITLIVSPQDAVTLNYLLYAGAQLSMALRASGDDSIANIEAVTLEYLLETYNIPAPSKLPYGLEPRIDTLQSPTFQLDFPVDEPIE